MEIGGGLYHDIMSQNPPVDQFHAWKFRQREGIYGDSDKA